VWGCRIRQVAAARATLDSRPNALAPRRSAVIGKCPSRCRRFYLRSCSSQRSCCALEAPSTTPRLGGPLQQQNNFPMASSLFSLEGHTAVVTGCTRGIGQAVAVGLAEAGADLILVQVRVASSKGG